MPRYRLTYGRQQDPAQVARAQAVQNFQLQRQQQASSYAAARFNEWAQGAAEREQVQQLKIQNLQSEAELKGAQFQYNLYKDNELRQQTTHYYTAMPVLQEQLKQAGIYPGSERYAQEMAAFASTLPDAITHNDAIRKDLAGYAKVDENAARISQMMATHPGMSKTEAQIANVSQDLANRNLRATSFSTTAAGGVDVKATRPIDEGLKPLGLTPNQFLNHVNAKQGKIDDKGDFTQSLSPGEQANAIQFQAGNRKDDASKLVTHTLPLSQFNEIRSGLGVQPLPAYSAPGGQTPTPTATPVPDSTPDQTQASVQPNIPQAGQVVNGFTFKGGDPADQNNWEQSQ